MHDQAARMREIANLYRSGPRPVPSVLAVTSGKGGVGKSTVALNLSIALADEGLRVLLFDADENLGGIDLMLGLAPRYHLADVLRGERDIEDVLLTPHERLHVLPGSHGDPEYPAMDAARQDQLLAELRGLEERHDVVIIDTAAGLTRDVVGYAGQADATLVVTEAEPTAVMDAYAMVKILTLSRPELPLAVVFNRVRVPQDGEEAAAKLFSAVRHFLRRELSCLAWIPFDQAVHTSVMKQDPVLRAFPRSGAALSLRSLAGAVLNTYLHDSVQRTAVI
jgi:flagellar biosynthesis protein FlhG